MYLSHPMAMQTTFKIEVTHGKAGSRLHCGSSHTPYTQPPSNLPASFMSTAFYIVGKHWRRSPGGRGQLSPHSALSLSAAAARDVSIVPRAQKVAQDQFRTANPLQPGGLGDCGEPSSARRLGREDVLGRLRPAQLGALAHLRREAIKRSSEAIKRSSEAL